MNEFYLSDEMISWGGENFDEYYSPDEKTKSETLVQIVSELSCYFDEMDGEKFPRVYLKKRGFGDKPLHKNSYIDVAIDVAIRAYKSGVNHGLDLSINNGPCTKDRNGNYLFLGDTFQDILLPQSVGTFICQGIGKQLVYDTYGRSHSLVYVEKIFPEPIIYKDDDSNKTDSVKGFKKDLDLPIKNYYEEVMGKELDKSIDLSNPNDLLKISEEVLSHKLKRFANLVENDSNKAD